MAIKIEDFDFEKLKTIPFWAVTEEEPDEVNLCATSIDEAIQDWKEKVEEDPESYVDPDIWEKNKNDPNARITVTAYKRVKLPERFAENVLDDVITILEENDLCAYENDYRFDSTLLSAAKQFVDALKKGIDPWYTASFDILAYLNKSNKELIGGSK